MRMSEEGNTDPRNANIPKKTSNTFEKLELGKIRKSVANQKQRMQVRFGLSEIRNLCDSVTTNLCRAADLGASVSMDAGQ